MDEEDYRYISVAETFAISSEGMIDQEDLIRMIEWATKRGQREFITTREGANFVSCRWKEKDGMWLIALYGGQPIHDDRHINELEEGQKHQNTWILVCSGNNNQMLISEVAQDIYTHTPLVTGQFIYLNTTNRHLVSRVDGNEKSIMLQITGYDENQAQEALMAMVEEWRAISNRKHAA